MNSVIENVLKEKVEEKQVLVRMKRVEGLWEGGGLIILLLPCIFFCISISKECYLILHVRMLFFILYPNLSTCQILDLHFGIYILLDIVYLKSLL